MSAVTAASAAAVTSDVLSTIVRQMVSLQIALRRDKALNEDGAKPKPYLQLRVVGIVNPTRAAGKQHIHKVCVRLLCQRLALSRDLSEENWLTLQ